MRRVLMLAYFFPPSKAAGTFRTLRFVRDLPALGWAPSVVTVRGATYPSIEVDPQLLHKVPAGTAIHRTAAPAYHRWYKRAIERAKAIRPSRTPAPPPASSPAGSAAAAKTAGDSVAAGRSPLDLLYMLCRTPDIDAGWYLPALCGALRAVWREKPDVLYATGGPWTTFLVARDVSRLTGVPLVLDYRDPWTLNPAVVRAGSKFEDLALALERTVVRRARAIVANTDVLRETLLRAHGPALGGKTVIIHNSYDAADYATPAPAPGPVFTLSYVGAMYDAHSPEPFLQGLAALLEREPERRGGFRVRLVGAGAPRVAARVRTLGLNDTVQVQESVPHAEAVRLQRSSDALLLLLTVPSDHSTFVPSKLYEYVAAERPIFAITRGGALAGLLRRRNLTPWIFAPEDVDAIARGLADLLDRHAQGTVPRLDAATVRSFSGLAAAERLAGVFESVVSGSPLPGELTPAGNAATRQPVAVTVP